MKSNEVRIEEYYVASIDLLGMKNIITLDKEGKELNKIRNIYREVGKSKRFFYIDDIMCVGLSVSRGISARKYSCYLSKSYRG